MEKKNSSRPAHTIRIATAKCIIDKFKVTFCKNIHI